MYPKSRSAAHSYASVSLESIVMGASPHQLITLLFDGAKLAVNNALRHMQAGETEAKGKAISRALAIISDGLHAGLDKNAGYELAMSLAALYDYMSLRLLSANLHNDPAMLEEVADLLEQLRGAWVEIGTPSAATATPEPSSKLTSSPV